MNIELQPEPLEATESDTLKKILLVDDDVDHLEAMSWRLRKQGFSVTQATCGTDGLSHAVADPPALIVLDLQLPDMNGLDVCERVADMQETCAIPIIIVSASDESNIVRKCRSAGCHFFVRKPYDPNALLALIERALGDEFDW